MLCPNCNGKGYKFQWVSILLNIWMPVVWLMERNKDPDEDICLTKETCYRCKGRGYLTVEDFKER